MQDKFKVAVESHYKILILQVVAVAVVLLTAVGIRVWGGNTYRKLSVLYHEKFDDITQPAEVLGEDKRPPAENENTSSEAETTETGSDLYDENIDSGLQSSITDEKELESLSVSASVQTFLTPVSGPVVSEYGMRTNPVTKIYCLHGGIDIAAEKGTDILAAYDGVVTSAGYSESYGYYVIIEHSSNIKTLYAHCSKLIANEGDTVSRGEKIALVGSTGRATGPHLHFEVRIGESRVNPRWILGESAFV